MSTGLATRTAGMPPLVRKQYHLEVTKSSEAGDTSAAGLGTFDGAASVYNVIDLHGDVIAPGAFDQTLKDKGDQRALLYQHDPHRPIGLAKFTDSPSALLTQGTPNGEVNDAREAMALVRQGAIKGLSIGFDIRADRWEGGVRVIEEIDLWEVSIVTWPANPLANITQAKSMTDTLAELRAKATVAEAACNLKAGKPLSQKNLLLVESAIEALTALRDAVGVADDDPTGASDTVNPEGSELLDELLDEIRSARRS